MKLICYASFLNDGLNVNEVIESIKDISLKKNPKNGITGFLVYSIDRRGEAQRRYYLQDH